MLHFTNIGPGDLLWYQAHRLNNAHNTIEPFGLGQGRPLPRTTGRAFILPLTVPHGANIFAFI